MTLSKRWLMVRRIFVIFAIAAFLVLPAAAFARVYNLTILHTNDHHGHFLQFNPFPVTAVGGLAAQSTLVNIIRREVKDAGGHVLLLSAGDVNTGVPESDLLEAEPDFKLMNIIGYDAMTLGNHEFDKSPAVLLKQQGWARFPFLSANIFRKDTGGPLVTPYLIKEFDGLKVAVLGLTTEATPVLTLPGNTKDLVFRSAVDVARELVPKLRREADIVIALTHLGFYENAGGGFPAPGDFRLAKEVPGIDVIVGGHTHTRVTEPKVINNTLIVQAGAYSEYLGRLNLSFDSDLKKITGSAYQLLSVNGKRQVKYNDKYYTLYVEQGYLEDQDILAAIKPYTSRTEKLLLEPVGETAAALSGSKGESRSQETNLGNLITDAMRAKTKADIALLNGGGIRAGIAPGKITYRDILAVQPFGGTLVLLDLTGAQIMAVLNYAATVGPGSGAFLHVSGLKWTNNKGRPQKVLCGDRALDLDKTYKVVTNNFMAAGGDGYIMLKDLPRIDSGFVDADALREYIANQGKVDTRVEGRYTLIKQDE